MNKAILNSHSVNISVAVIAFPLGLIFSLSPGQSGVNAKVEVPVLHLSQTSQRLLCHLVNIQLRQILNFNQIGPSPPLSPVPR